MSRVRILPGIWHDRLTVNAERAIFHQWGQLEASGCIDNFRIAAGETEGFREGWFFADSDAYKWLDAAARIHTTDPGQRLATLMDDFIGLLGRAQQPDGYIYTYNQIHFPESRWANLQVEHELYCHGHLIEAGVSHSEATGRSELLEIARNAAARIVADFAGKGPGYTPGHQEIEIALMRLYRHTGQADYLGLARQFIEQRGRIRRFGLSIFRQNSSAEKRKKVIGAQRQEYMAAHPEYSPSRVPEGNESRKPWHARPRWMLSAFNGEYFQQHTPIRLQTEPVGHSVRFAYMETAAAMLARASSDPSLLDAPERAWDHMVTRRMYVTGGIGSLPLSEGFGRDYELDPEVAYAETCAALGSMFWNWEMAQATGKSQYSDLFEWQLYNAAGVGMGSDGTTYLYNNPLTCRGGVERKPWFEISCCPSNISRTWADLRKYLYTSDESGVSVHQYVNSDVVLEGCGSARLEVETGLPWRGNVRIEVTPNVRSDFDLDVRIPSWASGGSLRVNGEEQELPIVDAAAGERTASGYDPRTSRFHKIRRTWQAGDVVEIDFEVAIELRRAHPKVKGHEGRVAITAGPLVYCLESVDNLDVDIHSIRVDPDSLARHFDRDLLGGTGVITARTPDSTPLVLIPYHLWGNRGPSQLTVWVRAGETR